MDRIFQYSDDNDDEKWYPATIKFTKVDIDECDIMVFNTPYGDAGEKEPLFAIMRIWNMGDMVYVISD